MLALSACLVALFLVLTAIAAALLALDAALQRHRNRQDTW